MMMKIVPAMGALLHFPLKFSPAAQEPPLWCSWDQRGLAWAGLSPAWGQLRDF